MGKRDKTDKTDRDRHGREQEAKFRHSTAVKTIITDARWDHALRRSRPGGRPPSPSLLRSLVSVPLERLVGFFLDDLVALFLRNLVTFLL